MPDDSPTVGDAMRLAMHNLERMFPGCAIALFIAPFTPPGQTGSTMNYICNTDRPTMIAGVKETLAHLQGHKHSGTGTPH